MAGAKVPLTFRIFKGDQLLREERLSLSVIKLGKVPSAHLKLDDETVSRMHAIIEVNGPGDVSIIDLGSTKGTFVNGQKVNKAKLQSGDTIVVGETRIELAIGVSEEEDITRVNQGAAPPPVDVPKPAPAPQPLAQTMQAPPPAPARPPAFSSQPPPAASAFTPAPAPSTSGTGPVAAFAQTQSMGSGASSGTGPAPMISSGTGPAAALRPPPGMPSAAPMYGTAMAAPTGFQQSFAESADDMTGARAVEVAAMLGDSVVGVKHCMNPRGGKVTPVTWLFLALGIMSVVVSAIAFFVSVSNAAYNKGKYEYETTCKIDEKLQPNCTPKPGYAVRPRMMSPALDAMAFGGLGFAIFAFTYMLARYRQEKQSPHYRIGTAAGVEFATEGTPSPDFPLVQPRGDDFAFNFAPGMEGEMVVGGQSTSLSELASQGRTSIFPIPPNAKIRVRAGKTTFLVSAVPQPRRAIGALFAAMESRVLAYFGGSLAAHLIFLFIVNAVSRLRQAAMTANVSWELRISKSYSPG